MDHPAGRLRRAPARAARARRVVLGADSRDAHVEPRRVGEHRAVHHVRRERRVFRPREAADRARRHAGRVRDRGPVEGRVPRPDRSRFRVPMLVVSPFSAGGWVCSDVFDHTSQLQFLAERFGVTVPNVSAWRNKTVGDLTATLPMLHAPVTTTADPAGDVDRHHEEANRRRVHRRAAARARTRRPEAVSGSEEFRSSRSRKAGKLKRTPK